MSKYTPGEWNRYITHQGLVEVRAQLDGMPRVIARISSRERSANSIDTPADDEIADADLIAAAPELVEHGRELLKVAAEATLTLALGAEVTDEQVSRLIKAAKSGSPLGLFRDILDRATGAKP